ncbi:DinB family protein [Ulvibacterium sp.]|uniref:DinB family protein n=1 Tax=Ulvibacterium sp. TaxID=2665914 RepID=UPI003BACC3AF
MKDKVSQLAEEFIVQSIYRMDESTRMIHICMEQLSEEEIWTRHNESSNSIGNQILHLCGNITQYAIAALGQKADSRERNKEFETRSGYSKSQLVRMLEDTVEKAKRAINGSTVENLMRKRNVQGFYFSGMGIVIHVVEHYSYHVGQIAQWTKMLKNRDLGFYDGIDLNVKNK